MPMSGSNYVAPTWVDKAPPALDAAELQAMCNAIESNQHKIVTGSYKGTGTYGLSNKNSIPFSSEPYLFLLYEKFDIHPSNGYMYSLIIRPYGVQRVQAYSAYTDTGGESDYNVFFKYANGQLTWYSAANNASQFNAANYTYYYVAFL